MDDILSNAKKRQKRTDEKLTRKGAKEKRPSGQYLKTVDAVLFNQWSEKEFVRVVLGLLGDDPNARVSKGEVLKEVAYELNLSTETVKRYLFKHTARKAEFREFQGWVFLNPAYAPPAHELEE